MRHVSIFSVLFFLTITSLAQSVQARDKVHHHRHHIAYRSVQAIVDEVASSPFYGPFGGYPEAAAAAAYSGPNARRYSGYVCDEPVVGIETSAWRDGTAGPPPRFSDRHYCR